MIQARDALDLATKSIGAFTSDEGSSQQDFDNMDTCLAVIEYLDAAIDAPEPEPDAYLVYDKGSLSQYACLDDDLGDMDDCEVRSLYAHPPVAREPLTDAELWANDQIMALNADLGLPMESLVLFARAIEAAHGVKS